MSENSSLHLHIYVLLVNLILLYLAEKLFYCVVIPESGVSSKVQPGAPGLPVLVHQCSKQENSKYPVCTVYSRTVIAI
jgi:hypothetical protein